MEKDNCNGIQSTSVIKSFNHSSQQNQRGQGTGLGLSLSYDISKAHSGEIRVETKEGEGAEFIIRLQA